MKGIDTNEIVRIAYTTIGRMPMGGVCAAERDDIAQEAAMRALRARALCDPERPVSEQRSYYAHAARAKAISVLRSRQVLRSHEALVPDPCGLARSQSPDAMTDHCAEDYVFAEQMQDELNRAVARAREAMSPAQLAVFDDRIGLADLPEEMMGRTTATRAVHARVARQKIAKAAQQEGVKWLDDTLVVALCTR